MRLGRAEISSGFFLMLSALLYFDTENLLIYAFAAAALHEGAHILAAKIRGGGIEKLRLTVFGAEIRLSGTFGMSFLSEIFIYLSGPAANILTAYAASWLGARLSSTELLAFAGLNFILGIFNLLPIKMMDGGNALRSFSMHLFGRTIAALRVIHVITVSVLLTAAFLFMRRFGFNITLFLVSAYLVFGGMAERRPMLRGLSNDPK